MGWRAGRRAVCVGIVGDIERHRVALEAIAGDRVVIESRRRSEQDIFAAGDAFEADLSHFDELGIEVLSWGGVDLERSTYEVKVVGRTAEEVRQLFADRYGAAIHVTWLGPTPDHQVLHSFGSWSQAGTTLRVWFGLDRNGESYAGISAVESDERIDVEVLCEEPVDIETLVGGFRPMHADVTLQVPVGDRVVVDASTGERRLSLPELRAARTAPA